MQKPFKAADLVHMMRSLVSRDTMSSTEPSTPELREDPDGMNP
jgi:hypothetical protein